MFFSIPIFQKIILPTAIFTLICLLLKLVAIDLDWNILETGGLINSLIAATIFSLGLSLNSVFSEYREVHKLPADLANHLESLIADIKEKKNVEIYNNFKLVSTNFYKNLNDWSQRKVASRVIFKDIDDLEKIVHDLESQLPANYIVRMRNEIFNIRKIMIRFDYSRDYNVSEYLEAMGNIFSFATLVTLMMTNFENALSGYWAVALIAIFFFTTHRIIKVLDNPVDNKLIEFKSLLKVIEKI